MQSNRYEEFINVIHGIKVIPKPRILKKSKSTLEKKIEVKLSNKKNSKQPFLQIKSHSVKLNKNPNTVAKISADVNNLDCNI